MMIANPQIEKYQIKYGGEESFFDPSSLEDGKITMKILGEDAKLEGRIKYKGFENWSEWISSDKPVSTS